MGNLYSDFLKANNDKTIARSSNITTATTVEGNEVIWVISSAAGGAFDLTVAEYDATRTAQYKYLDAQPTIIIKCAADTSANNVAIKSSDGAGGTTTHYTFAANYSVTPRYVVLRLSATDGADGTKIWEIA